MAALTLDDITVPLRSFDLRLTLEVDGTVALVGPSGAGKTTVLRAVAGLVRPRAGRIASRRRDVVRRGRGVSLPPERRRVGLVFQDYALFPHLTVRAEHRVRAPAQGRRVPRAVRIAHLARRAADRALRRRAPAGRARARARARPGVAPPRRAALRARRAHEGGRARASCTSCSRGSGIPTLLVTHDFEDAAALADAVGVIVDGRAAPVRARRRARRAPGRSRSSPRSPARTCSRPRRPARDGSTRVTPRRRHVVYDGRARRAARSSSPSTPGTSRLHARPTTRR